MWSFDGPECLAGDGVSWGGGALLLLVALAGVDVGPWNLLWVSLGGGVVEGCSVVGLRTREVWLLWCLLVLG